MTWHHLHYVVGLARLGHDVYYVEESDEYASCYDPARGVIDLDPAYGLAYAARVFTRVGLADRWAYHDAHRGEWRGPAAGVILERCADADLLLNVSGVNRLRPWMTRIPVRVLVDTDPVFTQIRHLGDSEARDEALRHNAFFTFGENLGGARAAIPDDGLPWQPTRQPIAMQEWPCTPGSAGGKFTTVMQWDSYPAREFRGRRFGMKSDSFGAFLELPARVGPVFELAIGSPTAPRELLTKKGWGLADPLEVARDPWSYQRFIRSSKGEFSVAKHGYVAGQSGWFSERSAAYLASGRPVLAQDTGFSAWLPCGEGVLAFDTLDEAAAGIEEIDARYARHCEAARALAEEYFAARTVLPRLVDSAFASHSPADGIPEALPRAGVR